MITRKVLFWLCVCALMIIGGSVHADIPHMINYQGALAVIGVPFDGTGYFKFAIVNAAGNVTYWSNDGTSVSGDEPTSPVALSVSGGRFSVPLGDTSLTNMTQEVPPAVFDAPERYLRIWFDDGVNGSQLLIPDARLISTPYCYKADDAQQLDGQDSTDFAAAAHTHSSLAAADGDPAWAVYVNNDGNVGIGITSPEQKLSVIGTIKASTSVTAAEAIHGESASGHGVIGNSTAADKCGVFGWNTQGIGVLGRSDNDDGVRGWTGASGMSGVSGGSETGVGVTGRCTGDNHGIFGATFSTNADHAGVFGRNNGAGPGVYGEAKDSMGIGGSFEADGSQGTGVYGMASNGGNYTNYGGSFLAAGDTGIGVKGVATGSGASYGGLFQSFGDANGHGVHGYSFWGLGVYGENGMSGNYGALGRDNCGVYGESISASSYAADFKGNVRIRSRTSGSTIVELGEGLDYAEGFVVSPKKAIAPGSVLIIDPDNPGQLTLSERAYDSKVAGIVAGANGQGSGVRLGSGQFDYDVALAGRVYCNVDATEAAVEPGDLLTTSNTPGYAMKATVYVRAQGGILGKAMERLEKGKKGQILVLVTLQ